MPVGWLKLTPAMIEPFSHGVFYPPERIVAQVDYFRLCVEIIEHGNHLWAIFRLLWPIANYPRSVFRGCLDGFPLAHSGSPRCLA